MSAKPIMHVKVEEYGYIQTKRLKQILQKMYGCDYEVIFSPTVVDIKADNMISLTVNKDTDYDELIKSIENFKGGITKPILHLEFKKDDPHAKMSMNMIATKFHRRFRDKYDVVVTVAADGIDLKSQGNIVKIEITPDTDINKLFDDINQINQEVNDIKKEENKHD